MPGKSRRLALAESVDRFEVELRQLAIELARKIIEAEFARVLADWQKTKPRRRRRAAHRAVPEVTESSASMHSSAPKESGRVPGDWTRDAVISELGQWLTSKELDPAFLKRHGPRGLVEAAKRIFGRFDAALNAANLAIAPRMQETRRVPATRHGWPSMRELARRQRERRSATHSTTSPE